MRSFGLTGQEWHAFVHGFFDVVPPWRSRVDIDAAIYTCIEGEEHYYQAGRGLGFVALICLIGLAAAGVMYLSSALG